jgi:hypothetical protein
LFGWWIWLIHWVQRGETREYGKDKVYTLPLPVCPACLPNMRGSTDIMDAMRRVPEYDRLLDKFPDAAVRVFKA